jgi:hypothetical protein
MRFQPVAVGAKGICLDDVGARVEIAPMNLGDGRGVREIERVEAFFKGVTSFIEHGSHRAVAKDDAGLQTVQQGVSH